MKPTRAFLLAAENVGFRTGLSPWTLVGLSDNLDVLI